MAKTRTNYSKKQFNHLVIEALIKKYGLSRYYICDCINGNRVNITASTIQRDYREMCSKVENALQQ